MSKCFKCGIESGALQKHNRLSYNSSARRIRKTIQFHELVMPHVYLRGDIWFTQTTGNVVVSY